MGKEDIEGIVGGLKNAIERGANLEKAKSTFLNAGYSQEDIDEAVRLIPEEFKKSGKLEAPSAHLVPSLKQETGKPLPEIPKPEIKQKKKHPIQTMLLLIAIIIFILMITLLGTMFLFK